MKRIIITVISTFVFTAFAIHAVEKMAFSGAGIVESTTGGFKFPDSTVQTTAATAKGYVAITSLPYVINQAGIYCLIGNLSTSMVNGQAREVKADIVTIDLNG
jgi:hypothetical protein